MEHTQRRRMKKESLGIVLQVHLVARSKFYIYVATTVKRKLQPENMLKKHQAKSIKNREAKQINK
jgi:hypothetical protein